MLAREVHPTYNNQLPVAITIYQAHQQMPITTKIPSKRFFVSKDM